MEIQLLNYLPLYIFIALMVSTPGPANLLFMSAGLNHGFKATLPFLAANIAGMVAINMGMAIGLGSLIRENVMLANTLTIISVCYMVYLSLGSWNSNQGAQEVSRRALSFKKGLLVQPLSPKSWMMVTLAYSQFSGLFSSSMEMYVVIVGFFALCQLLFHSSWSMAGVLLQRSLGGSLWLNRSLILLTIAVVLWAALQ